MNDSLDIISKNAEKDLNLNFGNIKEKALAEPGSRLKWLKIQMALRSKIKLLDKEYDKQKKEILKTKTSEDIKVPIAIKMQQVVKENPTLVSLEAKIDETKELLYFVQGVNKIFDGFNFTIKNCIDALKIESQLN